MAKRSSSKKASKHYPVQNKITMGVPLPSAANTNFIVRSDKLLSNVNHRLYRQSRVYKCKIDIDADLPDGSVVTVYAISDTWYNQKAYQMAKAIFDENSMQETEMLNKSNARWNDFRVDHGDTVDDELQAVQFSGAVGTLFNSGEYEMSEVSNVNGQAHTFRWVSSGGFTYNILGEYDRAGNTEISPSNSTFTVPYDGLEDELDDSQMNHLAQDGNAPPYDATTLEQQVWVKVGLLHIRGSGTNKVSTGFFDAPCGLIRIATGGGLEANGLAEKIHLEVKSGDYKGVNAPSYLE
jgi:hypothetical protein